MEAFSMPQDTKRIASTACQALPHRPAESLLCGISDPTALLLSPARAVLPQIPTPQNRTISARPALKACEGGDPDIHDPCQTMPSGLHRPAWSLLCCATPPRPAKLAIHTHTWSISILLGCLPPVLNRPAQYPLCKPAPLRPAKLEIHKSTISAPTAKPRPQACTGLQAIHSVRPCTSGLHRPAQSLLCWAIPPRPAMLAIHKYSWSLLGHTLRPAQASMISTALHPSHLHSPAQSPLETCL
jgi:hypothetical protein